MSTDQGPAVAEANGVGDVVVGPDVGAVGDARAWRVMLCVMVAYT